MGMKHIRGVFFRSASAFFEAGYSGDIHVFSGGIFFKALRLPADAIFLAGLTLPLLRLFRAPGAAFRLSRVGKARGFPAPALKADANKRRLALLQETQVPAASLPLH